MFKSSRLMLWLFIATVAPSPMAAQAPIGSCYKEVNCQGAKVGNNRITKAACKALGGKGGKSWKEAGKQRCTELTPLGMCHSKPCCKGTWITYPDPRKPTLVPYDECCDAKKLNGKSWKPTQGTKTKCRPCACAAGGGGGRALEESCGVCGDPHFKTWTGEYFDYHGECDLVLIHAPEFYSGLGLDIHIRTKIRYEYSFIESAAIKVGDDVLEVASFGQYLINDVYQGRLEDRILSGFSVIHSTPSDKQHIFTIDMGDAMTLKVKTFKDVVSINIHHSNDPVLSDWFGNSTGLMGSFSEGKRLARDGLTILEDPHDFGQEWMVQYREQKLFQNKDRSPQHPEKCLLPTLNAKAERHRRLGESISRNDAEMACAHNEGQAKDACVMDVIAMNDLQVAEHLDY